MASEDTLPGIQRRIEKLGEAVNRYHKYNLLMHQSQSSAISLVQKQIKQKIDVIEVYTGIVEDQYQITSGEHDPITEKLHIMQLRAYMD